MTRNEFVKNKLEPVLEEMFDTYEINHSLADASVHLEEGWPVGTDVYSIIGFYRSVLYVDKLYIVKEAINMVIDRQIAKLISRIRKDIYRRSLVKLQKKVKSKKKQ